MIFPEDYLNKVIQGDCLEVMRGEISEKYCQIARDRLRQEVLL